MKIYRGTDGDIKPIEKVCSEFVYLQRTADGEVMYENTHFKTEKEAWESILESVQAGVEIAGRRVIEAESRLKEEQENAAFCAKEFSLAHENYTLWQVENAC